MLNCKQGARYFIIIVSLVASRDAVKHNFVLYRNLPDRHDYILCLFCICRDA